MPLSSPKRTHNKPVPFQGERCRDFEVLVGFVIHIIKQAVDDYAYGKQTKIKNKYKRHEILKRARDAKKFLYSPKGMPVLLKIIGFEKTINLSAFRRMLEKHEHQRHNWLQTRT